MNLGRTRRKPGFHVVNFFGVFYIEQSLAPMSASGRLSGESPETRCAS
jgi:hypothetical protein